MIAYAMSARTTIHPNNVRSDTGCVYCVMSVYPNPSRQKYCAHHENDARSALSEPLKHNTRNREKRFFVVSRKNVPRHHIRKIFRRIQLPIARDIGDTVVSIF